MSLHPYEGQLLDPSPLRGRVALVTGGGRGIGQAIAAAFADAGARVGVVSRTAAEIAAVAEDLRKRQQVGVAFQLDITNGDAIETKCAEIAEAIGPIDILVNNAAAFVAKPLVPLPEMREEGSITSQEWQVMMDTNITATFHLLRAVVPSMLARGWGRVISISSSATARLVPLTSAYITTKTAIDGLTRAAASEWAPYGVTVNSIAPGHFRTAMTAARLEDPEILEWVYQRVPMHRIGDVREIGGLAVYLASEWASYITGQTIFIDGGDAL